MSALWMKKAWFYPYMESLTSLSVLLLMIF